MNIAETIFVCVVNFMHPTVPVQMPIVVIDETFFHEQCDRLGPRVLACNSRIHNRIAMPGVADLDSDTWRRTLAWEMARQVQFARNGPYTREEANIVSEACGS